MIRACSTASGGVFFIPDRIERKSRKKSYKDLAPRKKNKKEKRSLFSQRKEKKQEKAFEAA